jgi:hypothetical protein
MFNYNSPIVNNMMGYGGMYNGYIPPQPIGNMINIGGQGYNGGYYNGIYNNYFNPYLAMQQEELRKAQEREMLRQQSEIMKSISRNVNTALGRDVDDEYLSQYDPIEYDNEKVQNDMLYDRLVNLDRTATTFNPRLANFVEYNNKMFDAAKERFPDNTGVINFFSQAGELYAEAMMREWKEKQKDLTQLYNSDKYKQLINLHSKGGSLGNLNRNIDVNDMEITLPNHLQNEYTARKAAFLDAILRKG